ncbi:hypothetical protein NPS74_24230, partial [Cutibacterium acnes subsp. acnes]|nr:hypothetical protein [Cutibacterium acnes subsp. acnes]
PVRRIAALRLCALRERRMRPTEALVGRITPQALSAETPENRRITASGYASYAMGQFHPASA